MERFILALDQGTTSSRAIVFDGTGAVRGEGRRPVRQLYPRPGWVEHDPDDIWHGQIEAASDALAAAGVAASAISAVGIANQRETAVAWRRADGRPIANAIVWQCRRTAATVAALRADGREPFIRARTGLVADAYFSATKFAWLLDHVPGARRAAERGDVLCGTIDSWLLWRLTGGRTHATDPTNASRTMLFDIDAAAWDADLAGELRTPMAALPVVRPSAGRFGETAPEIFGAALPITGVAGDQQAALFGHGCVAAGDAKNTYGTGCFLLLHAGSTRPAAAPGILTTLTAEPAYALEGSVFVAGAAVEWLRDELGLFERADEIESLARSVPDSGGVTVVPAFTGLGAPHWDMEARGAVFGLTRGVGRAQIARATLEAIALQTMDVVASMEESAGIKLAGLRVDGGASRNDLLMQIQADVLARPVIRPATTEATALGAARLAGLGAGLWPAGEPPGRPSTRARLRAAYGVIRPRRADRALAAGRGTGQGLAAVGAVGPPAAACVRRFG
ncbi:MAG: glycerol kinase GlpK [Dehalococcoidia bacterium]